MKPKTADAEAKSPFQDSLQSTEDDAAELGPRLCSVYLVEYVPNLALDLSLTIGLLVYEPQTRFLACKFGIDLHAIKRIHPYADKEFLQELPADFERQIALHSSNPEGFLGYLKTFSNLIQVAQPLFCWLNNPEPEIEELLARYVLKPIDLANRLAA